MRIQSDIDAASSLLRNSCARRCCRFALYHPACYVHPVAKSVSNDRRPHASANARLAAIVDSSFDAIISKDLDSIITSWNLAAQRMFGFSAEEAVGQSILIIIPDALQSEETEIIARIRRGEQVPSYETTRRRKDGSLISVSLTVSPIRSTKGKIVGASKIARDISAAKESERRIRLLMREVNHRVKNQFAVILSMVRETNKRSADPQEFQNQIQERIMALSRSHDLLVTSEWSGASLFDLVQEHLKPFGHEEQISLSGPLIVLQPNAVQHLGMAFHELGTNSSKYGALSSNVGTVSVTWEIITAASGRREIELVWEEASGASPGDRREESSRKGFGSIVLERVTPQGLNGISLLERWSGRVRWALSAPLEAITVSPAIAEPATPIAGVGIPR